MQCEMCGKEASLVKAVLEGGELSVCNDCTKYGTIKKQPLFNTKYKSVEEPELFITPNYSTLIKTAREKKGMNQGDFAKFLNERESVLAKWESGSLKPRIEVAKRIGKLLKVNLIQKENIEGKELIQNKKSEEFTLADFIKVRKRK